MSESRAFDRAASFYDDTRGLPHDAMREVTSRLVAELQGRGRALEVGVGTGRIALPLHEAGIPMAGVDLSGPMMAVLVDKAGGAPPFPLARADATRLPFDSARFGAALALHVFHLIPSWGDAITELRRVVWPGGVLLSGRERARGEERPVDAGVHRRFRAEAGVERDRIGAGHDGVDVAAQLARVAAREREIEPVAVQRTVTTGAVIDQLEAKKGGSWTWSLSGDVVRRAADATRAWAERDIGPLDVEHAVHSEVVWRAYDLPL